MVGHAFLVAVEAYGDPLIPPIRYAERDAAALSAAFSGLGLSDANQTALVGAEATKAAIESSLRALSASGSDDDTLYAYLAVHGFSAGGSNYITCADSQSADLPATSMVLGEVIDSLRRSGYGRLVLFLDSSASGLCAGLGGEEEVAHLSESGIRSSFDGEEKDVGFFACMAREASLASPALKGGVWAHHLIMALQGQAPLAIDQEAFVTAASLQSYLAMEVPRTLRRIFPDRRVQTPWFCGSPHREFRIADLAHRMAQPQIAADLPSDSLRGLSLLTERFGMIRRLSGFQKGLHRIPSEKSDAADAFVAQAAEGELQEDLEETLSRLRAAFRFKRRDLDCSGPEAGGAMIATPYFDYCVQVEVTADNPSQYRITRRVMNLREPDSLLTEAFAEAFGGDLDVVDFEPSAALDLAGIIDAVEDRDDDRIQVDYDSGLSSCELRIQEAGLTAVVHRGGLQLRTSAACSAQALIEGFLELHRGLMQTQGHQRLPSS